MDVLVLIDKLDDLVHNAKQVPLTDQVRVDKERIYDLLGSDGRRTDPPRRSSRHAGSSRSARRCSRRPSARRSGSSRRRGGAPGTPDLQREVTKAAERTAEDIVEEAQAREREIRLGAEDYADEILNTLEINLSKFIAAVQRGRDRLPARTNPRPRSPAAGGVHRPLATACAGTALIRS